MSSKSTTIENSPLGEVKNITPSQLFIANYYNVTCDEPRGLLEKASKDFPPEVAQKLIDAGDLVRISRDNKSFLVVADKVTPPEYQWPTPETRKKALQHFIDVDQDGLELHDSQYVDGRQLLKKANLSYLQFLTLTDDFNEDVLKHDFLAWNNQGEEIDSIDQQEFVINFNPEDIEPTELVSEEEVPVDEESGIELNFLEQNPQLVQKIESLGLPPEQSVLLYYLNMSLEEPNARVPVPSNSTFLTSDIISKIRKSSSLKIIKEGGIEYFTMKTDLAVPEQDLGSVDEVALLRQKLFDNFPDPGTSDYEDEEFFSVRDLIGDMDITYVELVNLVHTLNNQEPELDGDPAYSIESDFPTGNTTIRIRPDILDEETKKNTSDVPVTLMNESEQQKYNQITEFIRTTHRLPFSYCWLSPAIGKGRLQIIPDPEFCKSVEELVDILSLGTSTIDNNQILNKPDSKKSRKERDPDRNAKFFSVSAAIGEGRLNTVRDNTWVSFLSGSLTIGLPSYIFEIKEVQQLLINEEYQLGNLYLAVAQPSDNTDGYIFVQTGDPHPINVKTQKLIDRNDRIRLQGEALTSFVDELPTKGDTSSKNLSWKGRVNK